MAFTCDLMNTKLRAWAANHPEYGTFNADLENRWQVQQLGRSAATANPADRLSDYQTIATAQSFSLGTGHFADKENAFWAAYTPPVLP